MEAASSAHGRGYFEPEAPQTPPESTLCVVGNCRRCGFPVLMEWFSRARRIPLGRGEEDRWVAGYVSTPRATCACGLHRQGSLSPLEDASQLGAQISLERAKIELGGANGTEMPASASESDHLPERARVTPDGGVATSDDPKESTDGQMVSEDVREERGGVRHGARARKR